MTNRHKTFVHFTFSLVIFLFRVQIGFAQDFSFDRVTRDSIHFWKQVLDLNQDEFYGKKLMAFGALVEKQAKLIEVKIDSIPLMFHYCNDTIQQLPKNNQTEYLSYLGDRINLDSLFKNSVNKSGLIPKPNLMFIGVFYYFYFNHKNYVIAIASERKFFRNFELHYMVLLEVKEGKIAHCYAFEDTPEDTPKCFGDFNHDGQLDYLDWQMNSPRINLFSLKGNSFIKDANHYIVVKPNKEQQEYKKHYDDLLNYQQIDSSKSKWFYKL